MRPALSLSFLALLSLCLSAGVAVGAEGEAPAAASAAVPEIKLRGISAPHPPHCMSLDQWADPYAASPLSLFLPDEPWAPCPRAIAQPGYTIYFRLAAPVEIDEVRLLPPPESHRDTPKARRRGATVSAPRLIREVDLFLFDKRLSRQYPIHVEHLKVVDGLPWPRRRYEGTIRWNPKILRERGFDRRREALSYPLEGRPPPVLIDRFAVVIRSIEPGEGPAILGQLAFFRQGEPVPFKGLDRVRRALAKRIGRRAEAGLTEGALTNEKQWLIFSPSGSIWRLLGDEEEPQRIGQWARVAGRIEVQFGAAKARPLKLWIDELPSALEIDDPVLGGRYTPIRLKNPPQPPAEGEEERPPSFEEYIESEATGDGIF